MANSHVLISSQTLGSPVALVTFGAGGTLPQTYRDLYLVVNARSVSTSFAADNFGIQFNSDTAANYSWVRAFADVSAGVSSSATTGNQIGQIVIAASQSATDPSPIILQVLDYSATDKHKTAIIRSGSSAQQVCMTTGRWASTSAITSFAVSNYASAANFAAGSTFMLYGVLG